MPLIEFQCEKCGKRVEALIKFADAVGSRPNKCPVCGGQLIQVPSVPAPFQWGQGAKLK